MQISWVISGFCLFLATSCSSTAHSQGLPDDVMSTAQTPAPKNTTDTSSKKDAAKKPVEKSGEMSAKKTAVAKKAAAPSDDKGTAQLKELDKRYQNAKSITMTVEKNLVMGLLGKEKKSKGTLVLSKGKMRLEITEPTKSIVVIDGKTLWVADYPPEEFKNAAVQVLKGSVSAKKGANQSFVGLLTRGGLLKEFQVTGTQKEASGANVYFLTPKAQSSEFKRAQLVVSADGKTIAELRYWDERDNATKMTFSDIKFDAPVSNKTFEFTPPQNADITTI